MITFRELGRTGRLGNMLFQVAGCLGIARKSGQNFAFPKLICHDMVERFDSKEDPEVYKYLLNPLPEISVEEIDRIGFNRYNYFWEYQDIYLPNGNWDMYAHFQSIKFFEHCIDEVRLYFTFKDEYKNNDKTCLHWRAGDYINDQDAYHPRCSKEYYTKALIGHIPEGSTVLVFSDDINEAYEMFKTLIPNAGMKVEFWDRNNYIETFKMMKSCKHFVCANSSYSHFAALLSNQPEKKIILPRKWFGSQAGGLNFDSLYPPNSIIL